MQLASKKTREKLKNVSRAYALNLNRKFQLTCKQAQVTTGSQWVAIPLNAFLLVELSISLKESASFQLSG
jgi:hypothetical protein